MGFFMDGLDPEAYDRTYSDRQLLGRIIGYFRPQTGVLLFVAGLIVLNSLSNIVLPVLVSRGIDGLGNAITVQAVTWLVGAILVAGVLGWTTNFLRQWLTARLVGDVVLKLREDAFRAVLARDMAFFDEYTTGRIVSRVTADTEDFATVVTLTLNLLSQGLLVVLLIVVLFTIDSRLALITFTIIPVVVVIALAFRRIARGSVQRSQRALANVSAKVQETMSGIGVAKAFRQEATIYDEFELVNRQAYQVDVRTGFIFNGIFPVLATVAGLGTTLVVYFGGLSVIGGAVSAGNWYLFVQSINLLWFPLTSVASFWSQFQQGLAAAERVFALVDAQPRVVQTDARPVPRLRGQLEFRDLDFHYTDRQQVLSAFSLTIAAGETIAVVGHTGAGKSTLARLLARFYEFQGGQILVDGQDVRTFDLNAYRRQVGLVPQTPFLFSGTVADNIRYARPDATEEEIRQAAVQIDGGHWLDGLANGLDTEVGETGRGLSLGQRQLVALARVLLQDPALVILDEATASVDPLTEEQIQEALDLVLAGRTAIVIAHRLSTVRGADRIIVLDRGRIVEEGNHLALLQRGGHYAQLYNTYFRHQSPDYRPGEGFVAVNATS
ncbi:MAG TPA: ABC transporter ATP-binding protein [Chloroflexota bacterium]|nr:ABC transporter ATP-binding protein [Chloroflexota bacterium]